MLYWFVQFAGWTAYFLFSILLVSTSGGVTFTVNLGLFVLVSILMSILCSHGIRYLIVHFSILSKSTLKIILITLLISGVAGVVLETVQYFFEASLTIDYMEITAEDEIFYWGEFLLSTSRSIILFLLWSGFYYAFSIAEKSRAQEILNLKWEASKNEIELKNLRAQLNPHFLFNSLNSIRALIGLDPDLAKTSVTKLSALLRRSINLGKMQMIPLKEELDLVKIYLDLEQVRFEERLTTEFKIAQNSLSCEIPPLMVQTIIENAIKHGISNAIEGGVVKVFTEYTATANTLEIRIRNTGTLIESSLGEGIGISNSKKRLEILFGDNATFSIRQVDKEVEVKINIIYV